MEKYVYLNELDSVNISDKEFCAAEKRLYKEIYNGKHVVLTFNQLADSAFFMKWIQDEGMEDILYYLIDHRWIVISPYKGNNSCVEYVLRNLNSTIETYRREGNSTSEFLLSSLPFLVSYPTSLRITIFEGMRDALVYSDVNCIKKLESDLGIKSYESGQIQDYIRFLLKINISNICYTPMQIRVKTFGKCVGDVNKECNFIPASVKSSFNEIATNYDNRSTLLLDLKYEGSLTDEEKDEIETAVNLAYNLTVAGNIDVEENGKKAALENDAMLVRTALDMFRNYYKEYEHDYIHRRKKFDITKQSTYKIGKNITKWRKLCSGLEACEYKMESSVREMNEREEIMKARPNRVFNTTIQNVCRLQLQQGNIDSTQTWQNNNGIDFEEADKVIKQIMNYRPIFK